MNENVLGGIHVSIAGQVDIPGWQFVFAAGTMASGTVASVTFVVGVVPAGADLFVRSFLAVGPIVFVALVVDNGRRSG